MVDRIGPVGPYRYTGANAGDRNRAPGRRDVSSETPREDSIDLSVAAREIAASTPEEREALVRQIRDQVQAGSYHVDPDAVARNMVNRGDV